MILAAVAGALFSTGLLLLVRALTGARPGLAARMAAVDTAAARPGPGWSGQGQHPAAGHDTGLWVTSVVWVHDRLSRRGMWRGLLDARLRQDLQLVGVDPAAYAAFKVAMAVVALTGTSVLTVSIGTVTGLPWLSGAWLAVVAMLAAFVLPDRRVRAAAAAHRRDFLATLTAYLDLVAMRSASGSGVSEALRDAAGIGNGYAWRRLQAALEDARLDGRSPASGLSRLGRDVGLDQLTDLASQLCLVDVTGAQTETTLRAKAEALREEQLTNLHGDANARSQSMVLGQVALGAGFLVLIGYPALSLVLAI